MTAAVDTSNWADVLREHEDNGAKVEKRPEPYSDKALKHDLIAVLQRAIAEVQKTGQTVARSQSTIGIGEIGQRAQIDPVTYHAVMRWAEDVASRLKQEAHAMRRANDAQILSTLGIDASKFQAEIQHQYRVQEGVDAIRAAKGLPPEHEADLAEEAGRHNGQIPVRRHV